MWDKIVQFYSVSEEYIKHLRTVDDKVRMSKGKQVGQGARPYIGIILTINNIDYLAPLTSYSEKKRKKFEQIPDNSLLSFKMYEVGNEENRLGMVQLNNMIPVPSSEMAPIDIKQLKEHDEKYAHLLDIQQLYLRKNQAEVTKRANKLYGAVNAQMVGKVTVNYIGSMSCNFKALEAAMGTYQAPKAEEEPKAATTNQLQALLEKHK